MGGEVTNFAKKRFTRSIVCLSAEVANAVDMLERSEEMAKAVRNQLIRVQLELEKLYIMEEKRK